MMQRTLEFMINHPRILLFACAVAMYLMAWIGIEARSAIRRHTGGKLDPDKDSIGIVVSATLTLLGLIIGFTFSMAATRYDQRRLYEEGEANAIGTEWVRAELLGSGTAATRKLLLEYLDARVDFYRVPYGPKLDALNARTSVLQTQLWQAVLPAAQAQPTPVTALAVSGMNDVLNSQGYTQFAWWNRIPTSAWTLMIIIALFANLLVGYSSKRTRAGKLLLLVLPVIVSTSFFLVADIDSPRTGIIHVEPRDLTNLNHQLQPASR